MRSETRRRKENAREYCSITEPLSNYFGRPSSNKYIQSLFGRVELLESWLLQLNQSGPPRSAAMTPVLGNESAVPSQKSKLARDMGSTPSPKPTSFPSSVINGTSEQSDQRAVNVISQLSVDTEDYLMGCFWKFHNSVFFGVHKGIFYQDKEFGVSKYYSTLLHIVILAMGYRFADKTRIDVEKLALSNSPRESILHEEAKKAFEHELEEPGGIPSIQALLLLGDLEFGCGRDNTGSMYTGISNTLKVSKVDHLLMIYRNSMPPLF